MALDAADDEWVFADDIVDEVDDEWLFVEVVDMGVDSMNHQNVDML